jgi:hypothetical protein
MADVNEEIGAPETASGGSTAQTKPESTSVASVGPSERWLRLLSSEAIVLAIATVVGYLVVFVYNLGAFASFRMPMDLIPLNVSSVFAATGAILVAGFTGVFNYFANLVSLAWADENVFSRIRNSLIFITFLLALSLRILSLNGLTLVLLVVLIGYFIYFRVMAKQSPPEAEAPIKTGFYTIDEAANFLHSWGGRKALSAALTLTYFLFVVFACGEFNGPVEGSVWMSDGSTRFVLLRTNNDTLITAPLHDSAAYKPDSTFLVEIDPTLKFFRQGDETTPEFSRVGGFVNVWRPPPSGFWSRISEFMFN